MNPEIRHLAEISEKDERLILGLMSGTSLDGLDLALCRLRGHGTDTQLQELQYETVAYNEEIKDAIRTVFARKQADLQRLCLLHPWLGVQHGKMVMQFLKDRDISPANVDLIASHGQTIFHSPAWMHRQPGFGNATLQLGDSDHIAVETGIISLGDFRQKHLAAGGEGAPLAAYGDYLLYRSDKEHRVLLNIGGIANYTLLPAGGDVSTLIATDTGPGNTLIDAAVQKFYDRPFDTDGRLARSGRVNEPLLAALRQHPFFDMPPPKTTGPELFNLRFLQDSLEKTGTKTLSPADLLASLTAFTASCIIQSLGEARKRLGTLDIYLSGGGMHNTFLTEMISRGLPGCKFDTTQRLGVHPDAKEAVLFAVLANEAVAGSGSTFRGNRSGLPAISMGKISLPR